MASASVPVPRSSSLHETDPGRKRPGEGALEAARAHKRQNPSRKNDMLPPAPRPATQSLQASAGPKVVDDEEFEAKLAAIIERDYFPDIKRLQNKLEWTQATESGEADLIANAQRNIVLRRAGFSVPLNAKVSSSSEPSPTPDLSQAGLPTALSNATPMSPVPNAPDKSPSLPEGTILAPSQDVASFTAKHTTEDQASLDVIMEAENARRRMRHRWAYEESDRTNAHLLDSGHQPGLLLCAPPSSTAASSSDAPEGPTSAEEVRSLGEQSQAGSQPAALVITLPDDGGTPRRRVRRAHPMPVLHTSHAAPPSRAALAAAKALRAKARVQAQAQANPHSALLHTAKSALYYAPGRSLPLSLQEQRLMSAGAPPQTIAAHTRFPSSEPGPGDRSGSETPSTLACTPSGVYSESPASRAGGSEDPHLRNGDVAQSSGAAQGQQVGSDEAVIAQIGGGPGMGAVVTPSPANLGDAAPIMTWGEVAGTPMVLDEKDTFQGEELRDLLASGRGVLRGPRSVKESAADKARKELAQARARGNSALNQGRRGEHSSRSTLSPAAQSFVKKLQGRSPWAQLDTKLRASYGHRTPGTSSRSGLVHTATPGLVSGHPVSLSASSPRGLLGDMTPERRS